jgi:hypothetical protein
MRSSISKIQGTRHRDIDARKSEFSRLKESRHFKSRNSKKRSESSGSGDAWQRSSARRYFGASEFGILEFLRSRKSGHQKSRKHEEKSEPSIWRGRVAAIGAIGKSPDRKSSINIPVIGISGILVTRGLGISESRSPKPRQGGKCHRGASCQHIEESGFEGSGILWANALRHLKARNPDEEV